MSTPGHQGQDASVGDDVPRQGQRDVLVGPEDETHTGHTQPEELRSIRGP